MLQLSRTSSEETEWRIGGPVAPAFSLLQGAKGRSESPGSSVGTTLLHAGFGSMCSVLQSVRMSAHSGDRLVNAMLTLCNLPSLYHTYSPSQPRLTRVPASFCTPTLVHLQSLLQMQKPFPSFSAQSGIPVSLILALQLSAPRFYHYEHGFLSTRLRFPSPLCPSDPQKSLPHSTDEITNSCNEACFPSLVSYLLQW